MAALLDVLSAFSTSVVTFNTLKPQHITCDNIYAGNNVVVCRCMEQTHGMEMALRCYPRRRRNVAAIYGRRYLPDDLTIRAINNVREVLDVVAMPWVDGVSLDKLLGKPRADYCKLSHAFDRVALGLLSAPRAHGDVKPANIMLSEDGEVKIGDFDLAEINTDSNTSDVCGWASLAYVSSERIISGKEDYRGDIFSLGASAYELLTGEYPFGNSGSAEELLERRRKKNFEPAHLLNSTVPAAISAFLYEMMAFKPSERPSYPEIINMFKSAGKMREKEHSGKTLFPFFSKNS